MAAEHSVLIAGAGPVGLVCALMLVDAGVKVTVLERELGLPEDMRASTFHPATLDILAPFGVTDALLEQGTQVAQWQYLDQRNGERIVFDLATLAEHTAFPFRLQCEQFRLTNAIAGMLRDHPLFELKRGARVTGVKPVQDGSGDGVRVEYQRHGETRHARCSWLVAADGGKSSIRKTLGLAFEGSVFPRTSITLVLDHPFQHEYPELLGVNYVWTADGHFSLMQLRDLWRFSYSPVDEENTAGELTMDAAQQRLQAVFPARKPYKIHQLNHYTLHQRCLDSFRHGRILFCGDAAHLNSPAGGMGMNSGLHDAASLVEHLLPVLNGADDTVLDRYDRRRRTIATEQVQRLSARNYRRHRETDPERRREIWQELRDIAADRQRLQRYLLASSMIDSRRREAEIQ